MVDAVGRFVYVTNSGSFDVSTFKVDQSTGTLSIVETLTPDGDRPTAIAVIGGRR